VSVGNSGDRNIISSHRKYVSIVESFAAALPKGKRPNHYKLAAGLCFSLRRAKPITSVKPRNLLEIAAERGIGIDAALYSADIKFDDSRYKKFVPYADEICAFQIGESVAKHFEAQTRIEKRKLGSLTEDEHIALLRECSPKVSDDFYHDILAVLRDHATSPFSLLLLYESWFLPIRQAH
jgi:hypothetical protein